MEKKILYFLFVFVVLLSNTSISSALNNETPVQTTVPPAAVVTNTPQGTQMPQTPSPTATPEKFRVGPSVRLRPVIDVIEAEQDGIVELYMDNPSLNDVTMHVDARVGVPSGIHVYGMGFAQASGAGTAYAVFDIPPGTARTIAVLIKADKSARLGSHTISFTGLYYTGDNKDKYQPLSLSYPLTVKEASKEPESPEPSNPRAVPKGAETPETPGFPAILAIAGILAIARLIPRR